MPVPIDPRQRTQLLYPLDDPETAFNNALMDTGVNPFRSNPFVTQLQKAAKGSRIAFLGNNSGNTLNAADPSGQYANFLRSNLSGGTLFNTLDQAARGFQGYIQRVKNFEDAQTGGVNAVSTDPYSAALRDIFAADDGLGALSAYGTLRTPLMGALGSSYNRALQAAGLGAMRQFYQKGGANDSPWDWLFPGGFGSYSGTAF